MSKKKIAITMGDPSGIGAEIVVKALARKEIYDICCPIVIGDYEPIADAIRFTGSSVRAKCIENAEDDIPGYGTISLLNLGLLSPGSWEYKKNGKRSGEAAFQYIVNAIKLAEEHKVAAVVTGPISKEAIHMAGHLYAGHTEIFADYTKTKNYGMLLTSGRLRVIHVTTHVSMREACDIIRNNPEKVKNTIQLAQYAMRQIGIERPRIGVAGLNAHASENGLFGDEEMVSIIPAIEAARENGIDVEGPIPPDTVFVKAMAGKYDVVVAMYHDQGHIPLKLSGFQMDGKTDKFLSVSGVNSTIGLPIVRTSVDHGTAYDRAGEGRANEQSMVDAIKMAVRMSK
ncbi:MAG: 4-hydroxythreonine-4-phosphate dehydrogenase PdxA [Lachnospiraceae bacterium]|nr:4-hydroxythreonine-4-phosphate dehydrogenase PdxA [Lachnospiraceae bacterium]